MSKHPRRLDIRCVVLAILLNLAGGQPLATFAQQSISAATLSGRIEDSNGAALSAASVTAINTDKNQIWKARSDDQGRYNFLYLPLGNYRLTVEHPGFASIQKEFSLSVGQALDLPLRLSAAGVSESVNITTVPVIETVRTQVSETVVPREIDSLPLNGRNYLDLAALTPGVTRANPVANQRFAETSAVPGTQINIAGQRNINNSFVFDGLSANDDAADLPGTFFSQEVIREFQVITSGGIAEFGRASGGVVNVVTMSGGNGWRGRTYGFFRNQRFDTRNTLAPTKDPLTQAQYGFSLGGPIRHDNTFLFGNFEQTRLHNVTILTISPANVAALNSVLDQINYTGPRVSTAFAPTGFNATNLFLRVDHRIDAANLLTARYNFYDIESRNARGVGGLSAVSRGTSLEDRDHTIAVSEVATLSPRLANEARFQFTRSQLAAPANDLIGPAINISGVANLGTSTSSPTDRKLDLYELVDTVAFERDAHAVKFGADFLYNRIDITFPGALQGVYTFPTLDNLRTGHYSTYQQAFGEPSQFQLNPNIGWFVQDEWRARRGLMVNVGLRYDVQCLPDPIKPDTDNLSPRIGLAYAPDSRTVIRASYGIYYDRIPLRATSNALQRDGTKYKVATFSSGEAGAPVFPSVAAAFPANFLPSITTIDPNIEDAYSQQASLQVEREVTSKTSLSAGYLHTRGLHLILSRNINVPRFPASAGVPNLGRPNPNFGNISRYESSGDSYYNGLIVALNHRFRSWAGLRVSYTFSKAIDDTGGAFFFTPQNNFDLRDDRGLSDNDQRHVLAISGSLAIPEGASDAIWRRAAKGFQLSYIFRYGSVLPFNIVTGADRNFDTSTNDRPVGVGRNTGKGFDFKSLDMRLSRRIRFTERAALEMIAEGFNLLNRSNYQLPNNTFGQGTTPLASFGRPTGAADPRQLQFGLRLNF